MPMNFNFKFFKSSDKGVIKKIERNKLPFKVNSSIKYILERKENINYQPGYLNGPFFPEQNMIEIIDEEKVIKNENKNETNNLNNKVKALNNKNINDNINNETENKIPKTKSRTIKNNLDDEKDFITIKKINPNKKSDENLDFHS